MCLSSLCLRVHEALLVMSTSFVRILRYPLALVPHVLFVLSSSSGLGRFVLVDLPGRTAVSTSTSVAVWNPWCRQCCA